MSTSRCSCPDPMDSGRRSCHDAVRDLHQYLYRNPVQTVIDVDLAKFFDTIDHELLMLREKINALKLLRYVQRMFVWRWQKGN